MASAVPRYQSSSGVPHLRRNRNDEVVLQQTAHLPAFSQVLQQGLTLKLSQNVNENIPELSRLLKNKIDNAIPATERYRGFARSFVRG